MELNISYKRYKAHLVRYRSIILYSASIFGFFILFMGLIFPNDADVSQYFDLLSEIGIEALLGTIDSQSPAWVLWLSLPLNIHLYYGILVVCTLIGAKVIPTKDKEGMALFLSSTETSPRSFIGESYLGGILAIVVILLPMYLLQTIFTFLNGSTDILGRLILTYLFLTFIGITYISIAFSFTAWKFNSSTGRKAGIIFIVIGFMSELISTVGEEYADIKYVSLNRVLAPTDGLLTGEWEWVNLMIVIFINIALFLFAFWRINSHDFIQQEKVVSTSRLSFLPTFSPKRDVVRKYPVFFEQLRKDRSFTLVWSTVMGLLVLYILVLTAFLFPPEQIEEIIVAFDSPLMRGFMQGFSIPPTYTGVVVYEIWLFSWLYWGLFIVIIAINIPSRDIQNDEQDILFGTKTTITQTIYNRSLAMLVSFSFVYWSSYLTMLIFGLLFDVDINHGVEFLTFFTGWLFYCALGILLVGIAMVPRGKYAKSVSLWFFLLSIMINISAFADPNLEIFKYLSVLYYFNAGGIMTEQITFFEGILPVILFSLASAAVYLVSLKFWYFEKDMLR